MNIVNDSTCSWINDLTLRINIKTLQSNDDCEWLIIGAGYTGLSAARKLAQLYPNQKIIIIDAQLAGEGASSRNSGYLVDTTLNDGFTSNKQLESYKKKADIYELGIAAVKKFISERVPHDEYLNLKRSAGAFQHKFSATEISEIAEDINKWIERTLRLLRLSEFFFPLKKFPVLYAEEVISRPTTMRGLSNFSMLSSTCGSLRRDNS